LYQTIILQNKKYIDIDIYRHILYIIIYICIYTATALMNVVQLRCNYTSENNFLYFTFHKSRKLDTRHERACHS